MNFSRWQLYILAAAINLPFFNFARYLPSPDWWTNATCALILSVGLLVGVLFDSENKGNDKFPVFFAVASAWWLLAFMPSFVLRSDILYQLPLVEAGGAFLAILGGVQVYRLQSLVGRRNIVVVLAASILVMALLQALIGFIQLIGLAPLARGYLVFNAGNPSGSIIGNIGQRNQLAQVLSWGVLAAAYLWSINLLRPWLAAPVMTILALVAAWTGGRLPLAYAVAMIVVAYFWKCRTGRNNFIKPVLLGALLLVLAQVLGRELANWLSGHEMVSGFDRLTDAGFGARRYAEWKKAWAVTMNFPWFGVGFGNYAYQSVWLETFGGFFKVPESVLFTHSHNLITQLLAETGFPATLLAILGVLVCLVLYCRKNQATEENAFLLLLALIILGHSMFEYPLWYLPFLVMFFIILALAPSAGFKIPVRFILRRIGSFFVVLAVVFYFSNGVLAFSLLSKNAIPTRDQQVNNHRVGVLLDLLANPFWVFDTEITLSNYLVPSRNDLQLKLRYYEQLVAYRPYPMLLCHLAMLRAWDGNQIGAKEALQMALASYPLQAPQLLLRLQLIQDPVLQPLVDLARTATLALTKGGDVAAVEAITKGLPVRGPQIPDLSRFR
ncbi:Wzy polymerase domain-containing protein [Vogesella facilis]|uniref:Wzy polymerase domain-containing protein n=1 Tax=Vogesella facilis TaxID=1655232 RepID=A0ABV7RCZ0_9NEIS